MIVGMVMIVRACFVGVSIVVVPIAGVAVFVVVAVFVHVRSQCCSGRSLVVAFVADFAVWSLFVPSHVAQPAGEDGWVAPDDAESITQRIIVSAKSMSKQPWAPFHPGTALTSTTTPSIPSSQSSLVDDCWGKQSITSTEPITNDIAFAIRRAAATIAGES
jgi:hypothetical protein